MINDEAIEILMKAVEEVASKHIQNASFDKTYRGFVSTATGGVYTVLIEGKEYSIKSSDTYAVGDTVRVLFEQNDPKKRMILGKVS